MWPRACMYSAVCTCTVLPFSGVHSTCPSLVPHEVRQSRVPYGVQQECGGLGCVHGRGGGSSLGNTSKYLGLATIITVAEAVKAKGSMNDTRVARMGLALTMRAAGVGVWRRTGGPPPIDVVGGIKTCIPRRLYDWLRRRCFTCTDDELNLCASSNV